MARIEIEAPVLEDMGSTDIKGIFGRGVDPFAGPPEVVLVSLNKSSDRASTPFTILPTAETTGLLLSIVSGAWVGWVFHLFL